MRLAGLVVLLAAVSLALGNEDGKLGVLEEGFAAAEKQREAGTDQVAQMFERVSHRADKEQRRTKRLGIKLGECLEGLKEARRGEGAPIGDIKRLLAPQVCAANRAVVFSILVFNTNSFRDREELHQPTKVPALLKRTRGEALYWRKTTLLTCGNASRRKGMRGSARRTSARA